MVGNRLETFLLSQFVSRQSGVNRMLVRAAIKRKAAILLCRPDNYLYICNASQDEEMKRGKLGKDKKGGAFDWAAGWRRTHTDQYHKYSFAVDNQPVVESPQKLMADCIIRYRIL